MMQIHVQGKSYNIGSCMISPVHMCISLASHRSHMQEHRRDVGGKKEEEKRKETIDRDRRSMKRENFIPPRPSDQLRSSDLL